MFKRLSILSIALLVAASSIATNLTLANTSTSAASGADWRSGRIIDDQVFTNPNNMSVAEIQAFLNSKVGTGGYDSVPGQCDTNGVRNAQPYTSASRAEYARSLGRSDKFTCLSNYYEVPKTSPGPDEPASNYGGAAIPPGAQSAAQIISNAAIKYNISPKALLVKLATESPGPLTSDDWPFKKQYLYAMGAHCPDSGPGGSAECDVNYSGFSLQIDEAASLLRWYLDNMTQPWWQYKKPYQVNRILWNVVERGCGEGDVYVESKATAALYTYTPYQPNQAALNNMYGTGDNCSAYGNRNFWRVWYDWFGSPILSYSWHTTGYKLLDEVASRYVDPGSLEPGGRYLVDIAVTNTGQATWYNSGPTPVRFGTNNPLGHQSALCDSTWITCGRPVNLTEASVASGQTGHFNFFIVAPTTPGSYREYFKPLAENLVWMNDSTESLGIRVVSPGSYTWHTTGYKLLNESKSQYVDPGSLEPGKKYFVDIAVTNTGTATWKKDGPIPVRFGTNNPLGHQSALCDSTWITCGRPVNLTEASVASGQTGHFNFFIVAPTTPGSYREYFKPLAENLVWMNDSTESLGIRVQ